MAIVTFLTNTTPMTAVGGLAVGTYELIKREDEVTLPTFDSFCNNFDCDYREYAFVYPSDPLNNYKNDTLSLLFKVSLPADVVTILLYKYNETTKSCEIVATLNDATYGTVYGFAYFGDSLRRGFKLEWEKVYNVLGAGIYYVEADRTIINRNSTVRTHEYQVMLYNEIVADGTVKLTTFSKGLIEGGNDYTGYNVNWGQEVRLNGRFGNAKYIFETDNYLDTNRRVNQIQDQMITEYTLELFGIPADIFKPLVYDKLLANQIFVNDYNLLNPDRYDYKEVYLKEITDAKEYYLSANKTFVIQFVDKKQDMIKRNV